MKMKNLLVLVALLSLLAISPAFAQDDELIFGVVLVGPADDRGWSQAHYEAGRYIEENVPGTSMLFFESLNSDDSPETTLLDVVELFVEEGAELIFTTSDAFEEDTVAVAEQYPDTIFINISGDDALTGEAPSNVGNLMAMSEWPRLVSGCAAALTTESGQVGYIGPLINAETRRVASSSYLGAEYCWEEYAGNDPADLDFSVTWIGYWFELPGITLSVTEEVNSFYDRGFDVVISGLDTTEMVVVAGQRTEEGQDVNAIAYNLRGGCEQAPDSCLGVVYYNWGVAYVPLAESVMDGTWEQSWDWIPPNFEDLSDLSTNSTGYEMGDGLSEEATEQLNAFIEEMTTFALDEDNADAMFLWEGPLNLQDGTELAAEGEQVSLQDIWYLPQILEGMTGASE